MTKKKIEEKLTTLEGSIHATVTYVSSYRTSSPPGLRKNGRSGEQEGVQCYEVKGDKAEGMVKEKEKFSLSFFSIKISRVPCLARDLTWLCRLRPGRTTTKSIGLILILVLI